MKPPDDDDGPIDPDRLIARAGPPCFTMETGPRLRYMPFAPNPKQAYFMATTCPELFFGGAGGGGKLLMTGTPIATPDGFRPIGDLHPGDPVLGADGNTYVVVWESELVHEPAWRLTFDTGEVIEAHDEHLWDTFTRAERQSAERRTAEYRAARRAKRPSRATGTKSAKFTASLTERNRTTNRPATLAPPTGTTRTTAEIVATLHTAKGEANHAIPVTAPLDLPEIDLPIDPYVLGAWLGDGSSDLGAVTGMDPEIIAAVAEHYPWRRRQEKPDNLADTHFFDNLTTALRNLGVLRNKHVPHVYLWASEAQRLALLQGLMDTDGNVAGSSVEFVNTRQCLTEAVAHLARSLGMKVTVREGRARYAGRDCGPVWRVKFAANRTVFRLPRKVNAQKIGRRPTTRYHYIVNAERIEPVTMKCIQTSAPDHLYLAGEHLIPTHNSVALLGAALQFADVPGYSALILRRSLTDLTQPGALIAMSREWLDGRTECKFNANERKWTFDTGGKQPATIQFGYLSHIQHVGRYRGAEYHGIFWDELGEFPSAFPYRFLFSRVRRPAGIDRDEIIRRFGAAPDGTTLLDIVLRVRGASNPGGPGMAWVKKRFVDPATRRAPYIPATFLDNPAIDAEQYRAMLAMLPEVERRRMELGDWEIQEIPGALWRHDDIRHFPWRREEGTAMFDRVYVGIDPSVGGGGDMSDECGIVAGGILPNGRVVVLVDGSLHAAPDVWSQRAVTLHHDLGGSGIVIENNQGYELLRTQIRDACDQLGLPQPPVLLANAKGSKEARAGTIAPGYRNPQTEPLIVHADELRGGELEAQMVGWIPGAKKAETGVKSPDRVDALVWLCRGLLYPNSIDDFSQSVAPVPDLLDHMRSWR